MAAGVSRTRRKTKPHERRGRRPRSRGGAREDILRAALDAFARRGYDHATIRAIGREAHVDPALVFHYFGGKDRLFTEAMKARMVRPAASEWPASEDLEARCARIVRLFLERWGGDRGPTPFLALLRSATSNAHAAALLRDLFEETITPFVTELFGPQDVDLRVGLVGSQLLGLGTLRYVLQVEPIASMDINELAHLVGPTLARYLRASRA